MFFLSKRFEISKDKLRQEQVNVIQNQKLHKGYMMRTEDGHEKNANMKDEKHRFEHKKQHFFWSIPYYGSTALKEQQKYFCVVI